MRRKHGIHNDEEAKIESEAILLSAVEAAALVEAAGRARPREACGVLLGRRRGTSWVVDRALSVTNASAAIDRFALDPFELRDALRAAETAGDALIGVWHSHPDAEAHPSNADAAGEERLWGHEADWLHLIVAPRADDDATALRAFRWVGGAFRELDLLIR